MSGNVPTAPNTCPTNLSALHKVGSIFVPTPLLKIALFSNSSNKKQK